MKTILVLTTLLLVAADIYIPKDSFIRAVGRQQTKACSIVYSEADEGIIYEDSVANCNTVEIHSLPPMTEGDVPVLARFVKGSYSLIAPKSLGFEGGFDFILEDQLTGKTYNLKSDAPYTFNVSRTIPDRFVMHVKKSGSVTSR